ncbi:transglutaminase, partial [candidate division KSB1 bacterium]|nr:transglutaminase [candidate division KSB1 bacterium]
MKRVGLIVWMACALAMRIWAAPGDVMQEWPAPGAFCSGLTWDGQALWVADDKTDLLYRIDPENGSVLKQLATPAFWPTGLAWDGKALWVADRKEKKIYRINPENGWIMGVIGAPAASPAGLAWDGASLWLSDTGSKSIYRLDPMDGTAVATYRAPGRSPQGLTFDGTFLWCADRLEDELYMIEPSNGQVVMICQSPGPYPRGLAWDGEALWNVDYQTDRLYRLVRKDDEVLRLSDLRQSRVTLTHQVRPRGGGVLQELQVFVALPQNQPGQTILDQRFFPDYHSLVQDRWGQTFARFAVSGPIVGRTLQNTVQFDVELAAVRYFIFPDRCGTLTDIPDALRALYLADGSKYDLQDPFIQQTAREIVGSEKNPYWIARRIFDYVGQTLEYKLEGGWNSAPVVLQRGTGSCSEYTFAFIALCRAAGLPARYVGAIVVRGDDASLDEVYHRWPEVYLPHYGWIPIDPQGGDKESPRDQAMNIGNLSNRF